MINQSVFELARLEKTAESMARFTAADISLGAADYNRAWRVFAQLVENTRDFDLYRVYQAAFNFYLDCFACNGDIAFEDDSGRLGQLINSAIVLGAYAHKHKVGEIKLPDSVIDRIKKTLLIAFENGSATARYYAAQMLVHFPVADARGTLHNRINSDGLVDTVAREAQITLCRMEIAALSQDGIGSHMLAVYESLVSILRSDMQGPDARTKLEDDLAILGTFLGVIRRKEHELPADALDGLRTSAERVLVHVLMNGHEDARLEAAHMLGQSDRRHVQNALKMVLGKYGADHEVGRAAALGLAKISDRLANPVQQLPLPRAFASVNNPPAVRKQVLRTRALS